MVWPGLGFKGLLLVLEEEELSLGPMSFKLLGQSPSMSAAGPSKSGPRVCGRQATHTRSSVPGQGAC